jgi:hypothetical protein
MAKFLYMESAPKLAGKARDFGASSRRMAVVEVEDGGERPAMISERAHGVVRIVEETTASVGSTERSYGYRERSRLRALADELNEKAK